MLAGTPVRGMFLGGDHRVYHRKLRKKDEGQRSQRRDAMGRWLLGDLPGREPQSCLTQRSWNPGNLSLTLYSILALVLQLEGLVKLSGQDFMCPSKCLAEDP